MQCAFIHTYIYLYINIVYDKFFRENIVPAIFPVFCYHFQAGSPTQIVEYIS